MIGKQLIYRGEDEDGDIFEARLRMPTKTEWSEFQKLRFSVERDAKEESFQSQTNYDEYINYFDKLCVEWSYWYANEASEKKQFGSKEPITPEDFKFLVCTTGFSAEKDIDFVPFFMKLKAIGKLFKEKLDKEDEVKNA